MTEVSMPEGESATDSGGMDIKDRPRFIIVADLHLNLYTKYSKPCKDVNTRFHHQRVILRQIFDIAKHTKSNVVFDGDIFDSRGSIDCRVTSMAFYEILSGAIQLSSFGGQVYMLAGNHDQVDNSTKPANSLSIFQAMTANMHVIDHPTCYGLGSKNTKWFTNMYFLPYSENKKWLMGNLASWIHDTMQVNKDLKHDEPNKKITHVLFGHLGVAGATMGAHLVRLSGEFSLKDLCPMYFDYIVLGHYHHRQFLNKEHTAFYVGNPIPLRHEDDFQKKGIWYLDTEKDISKFIPLKSPMFYTFDIDKHDLTRDSVAKLGKTNFVRVVSKNKNKLSWYSKHGVDTMYKPDNSYKPRLDVSPQASPKQMVTKYCKKEYPHATSTALNVLTKAYDKLTKNNT